MPHSADSTRAAEPVAPRRRWGLVLLALLLCSAAAGAGWYFLRGPAAEGPRGGPVVLSTQKEALRHQERFATTDERIFARLPLERVPPGARVTAVWYAERTPVTPSETEIGRVDVPIRQAVQEGRFDIGRPPAGWPVGAYRLDVLVNGRKVRSAAFQVQ